MIKAQPVEVEFEVEIRDLENDSALGPG